MHQYEIIFINTQPKNSNCIGNISEFDKHNWQEMRNRWTIFAINIQ